MVSELDNRDGLLQSFDSFNYEVSADLSAIETELSSFQTDFNETLSVFSDLNENITYIKSVYHRYNLHLIWWALAAGLGLLLGIKIISLFISCVKTYPLISNYISDWNTFRQLRNQQRRLANQPQEQAFPLVCRN